MILCIRYAVWILLLSLIGCSDPSNWGKSVLDSTPGTYKGHLDIHKGDLAYHREQLQQRLMTVQRDR